MKYAFYAFLATTSILLTGGLANPSAEPEPNAAAAAADLVARSPDANAEAFPAEYEFQAAADSALTARSPDADPQTVPADPDSKPPLDAEAAESLSEVDDGGFDAGSRKAPACRCATGLNPGLYCGYCTVPRDAVISCRSGDCFNNVYECSRTGKCHNYGRRTSCVKQAGPCRGEDQ